MPERYIPVFDMLCRVQFELISVIKILEHSVTNRDEAVFRLKELLKRIDKIIPDVSPI